MEKRTYNGLTKYVITEKEVQRKINHPFVCKLHYAFQTFDYLYLVSDFCHGGDLRSLLIKNEFLNESSAAKILGEVLLAIEEIHRNGIIHRDIKPENIFLDSEGRAKLSDFGLAKEGIFQQKLTETVLGGGTSYQIPEALNGKPYDKSVDFYFFGLLAYELMCGLPTFPFNNNPQD